MINMLDYNIETAASNILEGHFSEIFPFHCHLNRDTSQLITVSHLTHQLNLVIV